MCGVGAVVRQGLEVLRPGGVIVLVGCVTPDTGLPSCNFNKVVVSLTFGKSLKKKLILVMVTKQEEGVSDFDNSFKKYNLFFWYLF